MDWNIVQALRNGHWGKDSHDDFSLGSRCSVFRDDVANGCGGRRQPCFLSVIFSSECCFCLPREAINGDGAQGQIEQCQGEKDSWS